MGTNVNILDCLESIKKETLNDFIKERQKTEQFNEYQKGLISAWLRECFELGCNFGEKSAVAKYNPDVLNKAINVITNAVKSGGVK